MIDPNAPKSAARRSWMLAGALLCCCALAASGCAVGPDYRRPAVATPAQFKEAGDWKLADPRDEVARGPWWNIYQDPTLDALEDRLARSNLTVAAAEAA